MIPSMSVIEDQLSMYNARRSGVNYDSSTLLQAITDIGPSETVLYISKGEEDTQTVWNINQTVQFPENITVFIPCGVILNILVDQYVVFFGKLINQCPIWHSGPGQILLNRKTAITDQSFSDFFNPFVVSGGLHGLSPTCYSPNFGTEAYVSNGLFIREYANKNIHYGNIGANCLDDTVWVIISGNEGSSIPGTNFVNVPGSQYYIDYDSTSMPVLPPNSAYLMEVTLLGDQITKVNDLRSLDAAQGLLNRVPIVGWNPRLSPGDYTYNLAFGTYLRFGHLLYVSGNVRIATINIPGSTGILISGLPYEDFIYSYGGFTFHYVYGIKPNEGPGVFTGIITPDTKHIQLYETIIGGVGGPVNANRIKPGLDMYFTGTYLVNLE